MRPHGRADDRNHPPEYASSYSLLAASRRFAMNRNTIRSWRTRHRAEGLRGLIPVYPDRRRSRLPAEVIELIAHARRALQYGAARTGGLASTGAPEGLPGEDDPLSFRRAGNAPSGFRKKGVVKPRQLWPGPRRRLAGSRDAGSPRGP